MSVDIYTSSKCIGELCQTHTRLAEADCLIIDREISAEVFVAIGENVSPDMSKLLQTHELDLESWRQGKHQHCFESLLIHEEAYQLLECSTLDFATTLEEDDDERMVAIRCGMYDRYQPYLCAPGPSVYCSHYDECEAYIIGPNHEVEFLIEIKPGGTTLKLESEESETYKRLVNRTAKLKIIKKNPLVIEGRKGFNIFMHVWDVRPDPAIEGNMDIIRDMFSIRPGFRPESDCDREIMLSAPFEGDMSSRKALIKAIAAIYRLQAKRPFILLSSVRTNRVVWLMSLVRNLDKAKVGILCPNRKTALGIKHELKNLKLESASASTSSPNEIDTDLDYLIIYQAQSIGVTEAIESMAKVKKGGCVVLVGDPHMPNLRVRNPQVRGACGSILTWFYNRDRYPEYFEDDGPYIARNQVCYDYSPVIFDTFNKLFYETQLINIELSPAIRSELDRWPPLTFKSVQGTPVMYGCSPFNEDEVEWCLERLHEMNTAGIALQRIGVLTTYCAQKNKILERCVELKGVHVGIPQDFENAVFDFLIISTVETAVRVSGGKHYPFSDLLYDKQCLNLALTRGSKSISIIGDEEVLTEIDHWRELLDYCQSRPETPDCRKL